MFAAHGGTSAAYKSGDKWFELWQGLKARVPEAVGFVAGGEKQQRQGDLIFWPYLPEKKLRGLMRAADLLVYPARADNHPLLVLEAMSEGTASLAFTVGGVGEQIIDGRTGFLVQQDDWAGFLERLTELMARPGVTARAGSEAFESGRKRFTASRMVRDYMSLYRLALDAPVSPAAF
jgi:glycosyltransferase involved in cell wall biosynthesis